MTENDKSKVPEKSSLTEATRDSSLESSRLDSQAEPGTLQHVQNMKLLANQDSPSDLSLKCPDLTGADRDHIQNNRFEIVDSSDCGQTDLDSATLMAITAESDPAIMPVALLRQYADALPEGHADKGRLTDLSRQQAAALSPEFANRYDRQDGSVLLDISVSKGDSSPANWLEAGQMIAQLPIEQQFAVIGTALSEGFKQYSYEERERHIGQLIGTVQGVGDVLQFYATISDFAYDIIARKEERLQERGAKLADALVNTTLAGIGLFNLAHDYCYNIGYSGDYYKPFRDVVSLGNAIDTNWKSLPPREQERIKAQLITNLLADGIVTASGAKTISKLPKMTEVLNDLALEAKASAASLKNVSAKAANHLAEALEDIFKLPPGTGGLRPAYGIAGDAPDLLHGAKDISKGWRDKLDDLMNAMGGKNEDLENPFDKCKKNEDFDRNDLVQQIHHNACGFACLEMVTGGELKQEALVLEFLSDLPEQMRKPFLKANLEWIAQKLGPPWRQGYFSLQGDLDKQFFELSRSGSPWFAKLHVPHSHFVLVDGTDKEGYLMIRDPALKSLYKISKEDFLEYWSRYFVYKRLE